MANPRMEFLITVPTGGWIMDVYTTKHDDVTVPAGTYYLTSPGSGARGLLAEVEYQLETKYSDSWTVSISAASDVATGKVTIARTTGTFAINWSTAPYAIGLRDVLGFAGDTGGGTTFTGDYQARASWLPGSSYTASYRPRSVHATSIAPTGRTVRVAYDERHNREFIWQAVKGRWVRQAWESTVNESWERAWRGYAAAGATCRVYEDRAVDSYGSTTYVLTDDEFLATPRVPGWEGATSLWDVAMHLEEQP